MIKKSPRVVGNIIIYKTRITLHRHGKVLKENLIMYIEPSIRSGLAGKMKVLISVPEGTQFFSITHIYIIYYIICLHFIFHFQ